MAITTHYGKDGMVTYGGIDFLHITEWELTVSCDTVESTEMHATNVGKTRVAGVKDWSAKVTSHAATGDFALRENVDALFVFEQEDGTVASGKYTGYGLVQNITLAVPAGDLAKVTFDVLCSNSDGTGLVWAVA